MASACDAGAGRHRPGRAAPQPECGALLAQGRAKLFAARERRIRPGRDEKILTSWNALMIAGMARAARVFGRPEWLASARAALDFIRVTLWREEDGRRARACSPPARTAARILTLISMITPSCSQP